MIEPCSINVIDLSIERRDQNARGGDGTFDPVASGLRAHFEESRSGTRSADGRDTKVTGTLLIDGVDAAGDVIDVLEHDVATWTDWRNQPTKRLSIVKVSPFNEPGEGVGLGGLDHVELEIG